LPLGAEQQGGKGKKSSLRPKCVKDGRRGEDSLCCTKNSGKKGGVARLRGKKKLPCKKGEKRREAISPEREGTSQGPGERWGGVLMVLGGGKNDY